MNSITVEMPYIGKELSVNHYKFGYFTKREVKDWMVELGWRIKLAHIEDWRLPLIVQCSGQFRDKRSQPDLSNLSKVILDAIEEIKLELELDDRSDIGTAYAPGDVYRFFADLKDVINSASTDVMIVDPYFNGEAFDAYLSTADTTLNIKILADRYSKDISDYIEKHKVQFKTETELRRSEKLHDRIIFIDDEAAWIMGGSIKDAGKKATYLIPLASQLSATKKEIYNTIWDEAKVIDKSA